MLKSQSSIDNKSNKTHFMVLTDSISVLKAMSNIYYRNTAIRILQHNVDSLTKKGKQIIFVWVPGHCTIAGNKKADILRNIYIIYI